MDKTRSKKRPKIRNAQKIKKATTRVTIDFPISQHRHLKALAALEGMTLQEYIRTHVMENVEGTGIPDRKFKTLMKKLVVEHEDVLRRLADK